MAKPDTSQTKDQRKQTVCSRLNPFALLCQRQCLKAEGRESGVAPADSEHKKLPKRGRRQPPAFGPRDSRKKSNDERTADVHDQRAPRERFANSSGHPPREPPARQASQAAADKNPKRVGHSELVLRRF